jgi:hypothetical protein
VQGCCRDLWQFLVLALGVAGDSARKTKNRFIYRTVLQNFVVRCDAHLAASFYVINSNIYTPVWMADASFINSVSRDYVPVRAVRFEMSFSALVNANISIKITITTL